MHMESWESSAWSDIHHHHESRISGSANLRDELLLSNEETFHRVPYEKVLAPKVAKAALIGIVDSAIGDEALDPPVSLIIIEESGKVEGKER